MTIPEYINKAEYDPHGQMIFAVQPDGNKQLLLDVRGWGHIYNLFPEGDQASEFQDELGRWIADAINQKLSQSNS